MSTLAKRLIFTVLSVAVVLGWWTIRDKHETGNTSSSDRIPAKVWDGGAGNVTIDVESDDPAILRAYFASEEKEGSVTPKRAMNAWEKISSGKHSWTIDVPPQTRGSLEFEAVGPKPGSKLSWTVRAGEKQIAQDTQTLSQALQANEAFFLQVEVDDFATGKLVGQE